MAVFPERIVLKSSTDGDDIVKATIAANSSSPVVPGELVISRGDGTVNLFALDANNEIVSASVPALSGLNDVDLDSYENIPDASIITFNAETQKWENAAAPPYDVSGNSLGDFGDVTIGGTFLADRQILRWNQEDGQWVNVDLLLDDYAVTPESGPSNGDVLRYSTDTNDESGLTSIGWETTKLRYGDIQDRPSLVSDLDVDIELGDLSNVDLTGPAIGDLIAWDGENWSTINAPPVDLSGGNLAEIGDVVEDSLASGAVPVYSLLDEVYNIRRLNYSEISNAPNAVSDLSKDVGVSYWDNDAGYITTTDGLTANSLSDVTITEAQEGQMLLYRSGFWVNEFGPPANISMSGIGELKDVTYLQPGTDPGVLTVDNLGTFRFDSPLSGSGYTQQLSYDPEYGIGMMSLRDLDLSGSGVFADRGRGVTLRSDVNIVRLMGRPTTTTNRPELRFETGDSGGDFATGRYISFKMPEVVSEDVTYNLPSADGDVGDLLATDGFGNLNWISQSSGGSLGDLSDVDLATIPPSDGSILVYNSSANTWLPGTNDDVDLSTSSIDDLGDVDTTTEAPADGEGLVYNASTGLWVPGTVSDVDLSAESINALIDVDTSSEGHVPSDGQVLTWHASMNHWMPMDSQGGGSSDPLVTVIEDEISASGHFTFTEIGRAGILVSIASVEECWITLYTNEASRLADAGRGFGTDPTPGSGILSEAYLEAYTPVDATPGTIYYNNDFPEADAIYGSVRSSNGELLDGIGVFVIAYPLGGSSGGSGGVGEAPQDGSPYMRQDAAWVSAQLSDGVDGGAFGSG